MKVRDDSLDDIRYFPKGAYKQGVRNVETTEKLDDAMSFLTNFFALGGISLGNRRTTLELGLKRAYMRNGISDDISTHSNPSPTIREMMDVFEEIVHEPEKFVVRSDEEAGKIREDATWLLDQLRPFEEEGRHANLGKSSEFDIRDEKVIYLDLAQQEGSVDSSTALSIRLVTQTVGEFFEHAESEAILDQCAVKQFHRLDGMDEEWAEEFGLNHAQMRYVQDAVLGNEDAGFSEALVGVDGEWRGIKVQAMSKEKQVIDFDPAEQTRETLPGADEEAVHTDVQQFREELEQQAAKGESQAVTAKPDGGQMEADEDA